MLKIIFEEGGVIEIIPSCLKMIFKEGGIIIKYKDFKVDPFSNY